MGLMVNIYSNKVNTELRRDFSKSYCRNVTSLCLVNVEGPFEPTEFSPAAWLIRGNISGALKILPVDPNTNAIFQLWQFGGNYAASSDARFADACKKLLGHPFYGAVAIHDLKRN